MLKSSNIQISNIDNIISIIDNYIKTNNKISVYNSFDTLLAKMQSDMEYLNLIKLRKSYYPTIDLSTSYNVINSENKYDNEQLLMGQINISGIFYKGGSISYRKKEITNLYKSSLEQIKITIRDDKYKTREYLMNIKSNLSKYKLTNETLKSSKLHLKYIKEAYEHGLKDLTQLLDAEGKIISLRSDIINIGIETILEFIKLKYIEKDINKDFIVIFK
jgi:outer membrane protein